MTYNDNTKALLNYINHYKSIHPKQLNKIINYYQDKIHTLKVHQNNKYRQLELNYDKLLNKYSKLSVKYCKVNYESNHKQSGITYKIKHIL